MANTNSSRGANNTKGTKAQRTPRAAKPAAAAPAAPPPVVATAAPAPLFNCGCAGLGCKVCTVCAFCAGLGCAKCAAPTPAAPQAAPGSASNPILRPARASRLHGTTVLAALVQLGATQASPVLLTTLQAHLQAQGGYSASQVANAVYAMRTAPVQLVYATHGGMGVPLAAQVVYPLPNGLALLQGNASAAAPAPAVN